MKVNEYYRASSLEDAYQKLQASPKNAIVAGGLWMKKMGQSYDSLIDLSKLGLDKISETKDEVIVGSMVSQRDFEDSKIVSFLFAGAPAFAVREVMGVNFRNLATIGGSIMGRYPFSDVITGLLPYDVVKKVKTTALDFPIVNIAVAKVNKEYRVVVGARPMVAARSYKAMEYLNNGGKDFAKAAELAVEELSFMDNKDASKEYRVDLAKVYVRRGLEEVSK